MSVGLTYRSVSIMPYGTDTIASRKFIDVFDKSAMDFIIRCILLMLPIKITSILPNVLRGKTDHQYTSTIDTAYILVFK